MRRTIIALEGLVHAGKSTLLQNISDRFTNVKCIREYCDFSKDRLPTFPLTIEDASNSRKLFLKLEILRARNITDQYETIILDRSILSVLAYHYAVEMITQGKISSFHDSIVSFLDENWLIPQLCVYLEVSDEDIKQRHKGDHGYYQDTLLDPEFNSQIRKFYYDAMPIYLPFIKISYIDTKKPKEAVLNEVIKTIKKSTKCK